MKDTLAPFFFIRKQKTPRECGGCKKSFQNEFILTEKVHTQLSSYK